MQRMDALCRQKILLFVLDFGRIIQRCVHVTVAVGIWDALYSPSCSLAQRDCGAVALHKEHGKLFLRLFARFGRFAPADAQ